VAFNIGKSSRNSGSIDKNKPAVINDSWLWWFAWGIQLIPQSALVVYM